MGVQLENGGVILHPSDLKKRIECPRSYRMEQAARARGLAPEDSDEATEGTRLHAAVAAALRERRQHDNDELVARVLEYVYPKLGAYPPSDRDEFAVEKTIGVPGVAEGTPDLRYWNDDRACFVLFDWKFGHLDHDYEEQMRGYAGILGEECICFLFNPRLGVQRVWTINGRLERSRLHRIHRDCTSADAGLAAGSWCRYCAAAQACPALLGTVENPLLPTADSAAELATVEQVREWSKKLPLVERACKALRARLKAEVAACPEEFPDWEIRSSGGVRSADTRPLFERVVVERPVISAADFMALAKVSVADVEKAWVEARRAEVGTKKATIEEFKAVVADLVRQSTVEKLICKLKGEEVADAF
jgi:hypothetical protein